MPFERLHLKLLLPSHIFADKVDVTRIVAPTLVGSFGLLPNRRDCVAAVGPGILMYETQSEGEIYVAVDEGVLVKSGSDVHVSVRRAISGASLAELRQAVEREFLQIDAREQDMRSVMAKLESGFLKQFANLQHG